jgi:hypothetical protein
MQNLGNFLTCFIFYFMFLSVLSVSDEWHTVSNASTSCVFLREGSEKKFAGQETGFIDVLISSPKPPKTHPGASEIAKKFPG